MASLLNTLPPTSGNYHRNPVIQQLMLVLNEVPKDGIIETLKEFLYEAIDEYPELKPMLQNLFKRDNKSTAVALLEEALARVKSLENADRVASAYESGKREGYSREREYILGSLGYGEGL